MIQMLVRGLTYVMIGVLVWLIGLVTTVNQAGTVSPREGFEFRDLPTVIDVNAIPALLFLVVFIVGWLRVAAPTRVAGNETRLLVLSLLGLLVLLSTYLLGRYQSSNGPDWGLWRPVLESTVWHLILAGPAILYLLNALKINRNAAGSADDGQRFEDRLHMSFQYQIFAPSVLFCVTLFSMGVLAASTLSQVDLPTRAFVYLFGLTAGFTVLFRYSLNSSQGVMLYLPFLATCISFSFGAAVLGDFLTSKLVVLAIAITFGMGVAEVAKRYGQVKSGKLTEYQINDAEYFLLGSNWASVVFPTLTLLIVTTFGGFSFVLAVALIAVFSIFWLHLTPGQKASSFGRFLALTYGLLLPILLAMGFTGSTYKNILVTDFLRQTHLTNTQITLSLLTMVAFSTALVRLAKDTIGISLSDFLDNMWLPSTYLHRPLCLLLMLTVNSLFLIVLLCLFVITLAVSEAIEPINGVGQNAMGAGIAITAISLIAFLITFMTPGSVRRLKVERKQIKRQTGHTNGSRGGTKREIMLFIKSGRPGVSWIAGLAAAATYHSSIGQFTWQVLAVFLIMSGLTIFGFVANDIFDAEKDRAAEKDRPIANGELSTSAASGYSALLLLVVFVTSWGLSLYTLVAALFVAVLLVFYSPFSSRIPLLKGMYTALLCTLPFFVAQSASETEVKLEVVAVVFVFITFRELLLDCFDFESDEKYGLKTLAVVLGKHKSEAIGWTGMFLSFLIGVAVVENWVQQTILILAILSLGVARIVYTRNQLRALRATRISMLLGVAAAAT